MIDFRYHIVSLVSVFLALAVGIVLGAGPLRTPLGDTLTGQVDSLRADRDATRKQLESTQNDVKNRNDYINAISNNILHDTLKDVKVAVVALPYSNDEDVDLALGNLLKAGANITANVKIKKEWTVASQNPFRTSLSGQVSQYIADRPSDDASVDTIFGKVMTQILTTGNEHNSLLTNLLTESSHPMAEIRELKEPAEAIVVIGYKNINYQNKILGKKISMPKKDMESLVSFGIDFSKALMNAPKGGTIISDSIDQSDFLFELRQKEKLSTVDSVGTVIGSTSLPLALNKSINGAKDNYGVQHGAQFIIPNK